MVSRGIRGATTVAANTPEAIIDAATELLIAIMEANNVIADDVSSVFFTTTSDLTAEFPALAARKMGWTQMALMGGHEYGCARVIADVPASAVARQH